MKTIAQTVTGIIEKKPFLSEAINDGIINISSLARLIMPEVELIMKEKVSVSSIGMALKRYVSPSNINFNKQLKKMLNNLGDIVVRSNLIDITYKNSETLFENHIKLLHIIKDKKEIFYTFVQGVYESNFVISNIMKDFIIDNFLNEKLVLLNEELSAITLKLPSENIKVPGFYYYLLRKIAWEGINIMEIISSTNEFTVVVKDQDIHSTFTVIKNLNA